MQKYGNSGKSRFHYLYHEPKMRLFKAHSHTSKLPGDEARKMRRKVIDGNSDSISRQTTHPKPAVYRWCGGEGRDEERQIEGVHRR